MANVAASDLRMSEERFNRIAGVCARANAMRGHYAACMKIRSEAMLLAGTPRKRFTKRIRALDHRLDQLEKTATVVNGRAVR